MMAGKKCYTGGYVALFVITRDSKGVVTPVLKSVGTASAQHLDILLDTAQQFCKCLNEHLV